MAPTERVTVTLSAELLEGIDHLERNRSKFITEAVKRELAFRRRRGFLDSIKSPHLQAGEFAELGFAEWAAKAATGDEDLLDPQAGKAVKWVPGKGWVEVKS